MTDNTQTATNDTPFLAETTAVVSAALSNIHGVTPAIIGELIGAVHSAFTTQFGPSVAEPVVEALPEPAVSIRASVKPDYIVCLEDGKKLKMLKRHLMTSYNMTPDQYRARWSLPTDYPMVAPNYAEKRRELAKQIGLGRKPGVRGPRKATIAKRAAKDAAANDAVTA